MKSYYFRRCAVEKVMQGEKVFKRIDSYRDEIVRMQRELTAIPALSPQSGGDGEWKKALKVKEYMDAIGFDHFYEINCPDELVSERNSRPNQVYTIRGRNQDRSIWIMSHYDIVPPGERRLWDSDPYEIVVKDGKIFGRGVEDNQQGIITAILAARALKEEGLTPECNVSLLFISDEETGNTMGIQHILKMKPDIFGKSDFIIVPDSGSEDGVQLEVAEKSIVWAKFTTKGKQTHASRPGSGNNAFKAGSHLVVKLGNLYRIFSNNDPLFDPSVSTFEPTMKISNVPNVNTIPGEDIFFLDCRILPSYSIEEVKKAIDTLCREVEHDFGVTISVEYPQVQQAAPATPPNAPVVKAMERAISDIYHVEAKPTGIGGGTVAAYIRKAGFPAVVWARLNETAHQPNEHCSIDNVIGDAKVFAHLFLQQ
jgi:succinyl-diaminopimelate desuccinylase